MYTKHGVTFRLECIGEAIGVHTACVQIAHPARVPRMLVCSDARDLSSFFHDRVRGKRDVVAFFENEPRLRIVYTLPARRRLP